MNYISRTLTYRDKDDNLKYITDDELLNVSQSVVILAEPGMGKTSLLEYLSNSDNTVKLTASSFVRRPLGRLKNIGNKVVLIDALDEYQADKNSNSIDNILAKLYELGSPRFILTCREVEWDEASNSVFEDFYNEKPIVAHIEAFTRDDAIKFLNEHNNFSGNSEDIVYQLDELSLSDFYNNPLTLDLLTNVDIKNLPDNKADIFELATRNLWQEINDSAPNKLQQTDENIIIECAGFICATLLLSQKQNIFTGNISKTPDDALNIHKLKSIFDEYLLSNTIKCRIFKRSIDNQNFRPMHRTIAEFLGAKWLAKKMLDPIIKKRLLEQFTYKDGVPSSLRGMFAWLAYFNPNLTQTIINTDPYGLITYADTSFFSDNQSKLLYKSLKKLAEVDPWFRKDTWGRLQAKGLAKPCLYNEYRELFTTKDLHRFNQLRVSILQVLQDAYSIDELVDELKNIAFNYEYRYLERYEALTLLVNKKITIDSTYMDQLVNSKQEDDLRLICELVAKGNSHIVTNEQIVALVLNAQPLNTADSFDSRIVPDIGGYYYFKKIPTSRIIGIINNLIVSIKDLAIPEYEESREHSKTINNLLIYFINRLIGEGIRISTKLFFDSITLFYHNEANYLLDDEADYKASFSYYFSKNEPDKLTIQTSLIKSHNAFSRFHQLARSVFHTLYPSTEDLKELLNHIQELEKTDRNIQAWKDLIQLSYINNVIPNTIIEHVGLFVSKNPELESFLKILAEPRKKSDRELKIQKGQRKSRISTRESHQNFRRRLKKNILELEAGNYKFSTYPAKLIVTDNYHSPNNLSPYKSIQYVLKNELTKSALLGFENALHGIFYSASEIVDLHLNNMRYNPGATLIAGLYMRYLEDKPTDDLSDELILTCSVIYEFDHFLSFDYEKQTGFSEFVKEILLERDLKYKLIHIILKPQFDNKRQNISGLHWLTDIEPTDNNLDYIVNVLNKYDYLNLENQRLLTRVLIKNNYFHKLESTIRRITLNIDKVDNDDKSAFWLALHSYVDEQDFMRSLSLFSKPELVFWHIKEINNSPWHNFNITSSNSIKVWLIEQFNKAYPDVDHPMSTCGVRNPWDASSFIKSLLNSLSNIPTNEVRETLIGFKGHIHKSYKTYLDNLLVQQQNKIREQNYAPRSLESLLNIYQNEPPKDCVDLKALVITLLDEIQAEIYGSETDPHRAFYQSISTNAKNVPHGENDCRDRLAYFLKLKLQAYGFRLETERDMPDDKRADMVCSHANLHLPIEVKGQWHKDLWTAMNDQLGKLYLKEHLSQRKGIYLIFWFGQNVVNNRSLNTTAFNKTGISEKPNNAKELKSLLDDWIEDKYKNGIEIYVMDISRD